MLTRCHVVSLIALFAWTACGQAQPVSPVTPAQASPVTPAHAAPPTAPALFGALAPGRYPVGFRQIVTVDPARAYRSPFVRSGAADQRRPIVMNLWYPARTASGAAVTAAAYLRVPDSDKLPKQFADRLSRHARSVVAYEILNRDPTLIPPALRERIDDALSEPALARRDAEPAPGPFPLVIGHAGLIAAFNDNFLLWEYLASHGYVVVTSTFVSRDPSKPYIDWDPERSIEDVHFILRELASFSNIDHSRVAAVGHSYGAQASLALGMQNRRIDAVVSIDSTFENKGPDGKPWYREARPQHFIGRVEQLTVPTLVFATARASVMGYIESLELADRHFVAVPHLSHNAFISTGGLLGPLVFTRDDDIPASFRDRMIKRRRAYEFVLETTRRFLDSALRDRDEQAWFAKIPAHLAGARYRHYPARWPRTDQAALTHLVVERGVSAARALCAAVELCQKQRRERFDNLGAALTEAGEYALAEQVYRANRDDFPAVWQAHNAHAKALARLGRYEDARAAFASTRDMIDKDPKLDERWRTWEREAVDEYLGWISEMSATGSRAE